MAGDLRQKRSRSGAPSQTSMDMGTGDPPPEESRGPTAGTDRRPQWARDPEAPPAGAVVTEEQAQEFRGFRLESIGEAFRLAAACVEGKMVPKGMTEGAVVAIWQRGYEAGMQPMEALESLFIINGKPGMYVEKLVTRARERNAFAEGGRPTLRWWVGNEEKSEGWEPALEWKRLEDWPDDLRAVVSARPAKDPEVVLSRSFSVQDAKLAKKWMCDTDSPWMKYPTRQLRARATGFLMRDEFGEFNKGIAPAEELADIEDRTEKDITEAARSAPEGRDPALEAAKQPDSIERKDGTPA
jgi:hypothetical protein